jgi:hypothetical protein
MFVPLVTRLETFTGCDALGVTGFLAVLATVSGVIPDETVTVNVLVALNGGVPLSVTTVVTRLVVFA